MNQGRLDQAEPLFRSALSVFNQLVKYDDANAIWRADRAISAYHLAQLLLESGNEDNAKGLLDQAILDFEQSVVIDSGDLRVVENLALAQQLQASLMLEESIDEALALSAQSQTRILELVDMGTSKPRTVINAADHDQFRSQDVEDMVKWVRTFMEEHLR